MRDGRDDRRRGHDRRRRQRGCGRQRRGSARRRRARRGTDRARRAARAADAAARRVAAARRQRRRRWRDRPASAAGSCSRRCRAARGRSSTSPRVKGIVYAIGAFGTAADSQSPRGVRSRDQHLDDEGVDSVLRPITPTSPRPPTSSTSWARSARRTAPSTIPVAEHLDDEGAASRPSARPRRPPRSARRSTSRAARWDRTAPASDRRCATSPSSTPSPTRWETLDPIPAPGRNHAVGAAVERHLLHHRRTDQRPDGRPAEPRRRLRSVDPDSGRQKATMPVARGGCMGGVVNGQIVIVGGEGNARDINPNGVFPDTDVYDPVADMLARDGADANAPPRHRAPPASGTSSTSRAAPPRRAAEPRWRSWKRSRCRRSRPSARREDDAENEDDHGRSERIRVLPAVAQPHPPPPVIGGSGNGVGGSGSGSALHTVASQIVPGDIAPCPASAWQLAWHCGVVAHAAEDRLDLVVGHGRVPGRALVGRRAERVPVAEVVRRRVHDVAAPGQRADARRIRAPSRTSRRRRAIGTARASCWNRRARRAAASRSASCDV